MLVLRALNTATHCIRGVAYTSLCNANNRGRRGRIHYGIGLAKGSTVYAFFCVGGEKQSTDVLIVSGGIAGVLCAYKLKNAGVDCMLVEAAELT